MIFIMLSLVDIVRGCNEFCAVSCQVFNSPASCYEFCECPATVPQFSVPENLLTDYLEFEAMLFKSIQCSKAEYVNCGKVKTYSEFLECMHSANCQEAVKFQSIIKRIPARFWIAISPPMLLSYVQDRNETEYYKEFDSCQKFCYGELLLALGENLKDDRIGECINVCYRNVVKMVDKNCRGQCKEICRNPNCFKNCMRKKCEKENQSLEDENIEEIEPWIEIPNPQVNEKSEKIISNDL
jgi:hypothetical protein